MIGREAQRACLGFWSVDLANGMATLCREAAAMLGLPAAGQLELALVFARIRREHRHRLLRAALRSIRSGDLFDVVVRTASTPAAPGLRILGGRGYHVSHHCEIHGILERVAAVSGP
ncbi:MAG TPA: hypothetical protein VHA82_13735 [Ramlibacter sp.]|uniref:hypothetical protein n=1 Tax=Ramlibacter sp. TaxID=1917967 RepID=UPI002B754BD2|nr:hypothetical protein [Ramlibacter sp.]HVZ44867.1 hypothetical protein [Ramlibacter sp.]